MLSVWAKCVLLIMMVVTIQVIFTGAARVGVNYGLLGDNLPSPGQAVEWIKRSNIPTVKQFEPNLQVLEALRGTNIVVCIGTRNEDLIKLSNEPNSADDWLNTNISPYPDVRFLWVTAGNEVIPGPDAQYVLPAIKNLEASLNKAGLGKIQVTTVVATIVLGNSYPPSQGAFGQDSSQTMTDITDYLYYKGSPVMINVYPYFALVSDPDNISLDYALFQKLTKSFTDQGRDYYSLLHSIVDAFRAGLAKTVGKDDLQIIISETGWPSAGNPPYASVDNARIYNNNLKNHVLTKGTLAKPEQLLVPFIFALFNEDQKPAGAEQNYGPFYPDMNPVYNLW